MKVISAGAYGKLGTDVLKTLVREGHDVLAADGAKRLEKRQNARYGNDTTPVIIPFVPLYHPVRK